MNEMNEAKFAPRYLLLLALITLGQIGLLDRLLYTDPTQYNFVLRNVREILAGTPVWKAFQNRVIGAALVTGLNAATGDGLTSLKLFGGLMTAAATLLLFLLIQRQGGTNLGALLAVVCFGFVRLLLTFRLEFPWDGLDILLFLALGHWARTGTGLLNLVPLALIGALNHETALFIPLWYMLGFLDRPRPAGGSARAIVGATILMAGMIGIIAVVRNHFYVGHPDIPGQAFEPTTPGVSNPIHLSHNLRQLFWEDWKAVKRIFVSASLLSAVGLLVVAAKIGFVRASAWSLLVLGSIFLFGYINETRLYFPLVSFWFTYAWPIRTSRPAMAAVS